MLDPWRLAVVDLSVKVEVLVVLAERLWDVDIITA